MNPTNAGEVLVEPNEIMKLHRTIDRLETNPIGKIDLPLDNMYRRLYYIKKGTYIHCFIM